MTLNSSPQLPASFHDSTAGMTLCLAGQRELLVNGQLYDIRPGMIIFISPIITVIELSRSADYEEQSIRERIDTLYDAVQPIYDTLVRLRFYNDPCVRLNAEQQALFLERASLMKARREQLSRAESADEAAILRQLVALIAKETILEFVHIRLQAASVSPVPAQKNDMVLFRFLTSLIANYRTQRNVGAYAAELALSQSQFTRIIRARTGLTPSDWIANITIVGAKQLLKSSDASIKEVAAELGFPEQFTFRKYFKQRVGISPKEFRAQASNAEAE